MKELEGLEENEVFNYGLLCGIKLFQQKIVTAHKRKEHLMIDGNIYGASKSHLDSYAGPSATGEAVDY